MRKDWLSAVLVAMLVLFGNDVSASPKLGVSLPERSGESCGSAIDEVKKDLAERGYFIPWKGTQGNRIYPRTELNGGEIQEAYYDYPKDRTDTVTFFLAGDSMRLYQGLMSSPVLMMTLGGRVMSACDRVGMINFLHWYEGGVPVGYFSDGTVRVFQWTDRNGSDGQYQRRTETPEGTRIHYKWGFYSSP